MQNAGPLCLGLDFGTSKVAAVVVDQDTGHPEAVHSLHTRASLPSPDRPHYEQDVATILAVARKCIALLSASQRARVARIGITGQMHGALLWRENFRVLSPLVTWQDTRATFDNCLKEFQADTNSGLRDGYGATTLAWWSRFQPQLLGEACNASTIHDYVACLLTGRPRGITDPSDGASWGLFDLKNFCWQEEDFSKLGIPLHLLPEIVPSGSLFGDLTPEAAASFGLPANIPIGVPLGDNQASMYAVLEDDSSDCCLTLGTGGQLSFVIPSFDIALRFQSETFEIRPYTQGRYLGVAASLSGGLSMRWLVESLQGIFRELQLEPPDEMMLFQALDRCGKESLSSPLVIESHFLGERYDPNLRGNIKNIDLNNFTLGNLSAALVRSVFTNLASMIPKELLQSRKRILGTGNGLRRLSLARHYPEQVFGLPLELKEIPEETAVGAARLVSHMR